MVPLAAKNLTWLLWFDCLFHFTETIVTINRPTRARFKRHLSIFSASGTFCRIHPSGGNSVVYVSGSDWNNTFTFRCCLLSFYPACLTAFRGIKSPHSCKLLLFSNREGEDGSAIVTGNLFVDVTHWDDHPFVTRLGFWSSNSYWGGYGVLLLENPPKPGVSIHQIGKIFNVIIYLVVHHFEMILNYKGNAP